MAETYTKLFSTIITSSIWSEDDKTRILWVTMLALADFNGKVEGSIRGIADMARLSVEDTERAIAKLIAPDLYSRSKNNDGRRIKEVDGGYLIINHAKYRNKGKSRAKYYQDWRAKTAQLCATQTDTNTETDTEVNNIMAIFDRARKLYKGFKRGNEAEFKNFVRHKDWRDALPLLYPAIEKEIAYKQSLIGAGKWCPDWAHFATWINGRRWTQEFPEIAKPLTGSEIAKGSLI